MDDRNLELITKFFNGRRRNAVRIHVRCNVQVFPQLFQVLSNFHGCLYITQWKLQESVFYVEKTAQRK